MIAPAQVRSGSDRPAIAASAGCRGSRWRLHTVRAAVMGGTVNLGSAGFASGGSASLVARLDRLAPVRDRAPGRGYTTLHRRHGRLAARAQWLLNWPSADAKARGGSTATQVPKPGSAPRPASQPSLANLVLQRALRTPQRHGVVWCVLPCSRGQKEFQFAVPCSFSRSAIFSSRISGDLGGGKLP